MAEAGVARGADSLATAAPKTQATPGKLTTQPAWDGQTAVDAAKARVAAKRLPLSSYLGRSSPRAPKAAPNTDRGPTKDAKPISKLTSPGRTTRSRASGAASPRADLGTINEYGQMTSPSSKLGSPRSPNVFHRLSSDLQERSQRQEELKK